jgi:SAM-dependent methyltransferase
MKCPICATHCDSFVDAKQHTEYHACPACGYWFKSPRHHADLSQQKCRYDLHENDPDDLGYRAYFQRFLDWVLPQISRRQGRVLDFGCGASGLLAGMLQEQGFGAVRYDPIYYPDESYRDHRYDLIVSTEVFEHLSDPLAILRHLRELLNPGGHLALQTQFLPPGRDVFFDWYYRLDPTHIGFFAPETFRYMAREVGLRNLGNDGRNKILFQQ